MLVHTRIQLTQHWLFVMEEMARWSELLPRLAGIEFYRFWQHDIDFKAGNF